MAATRGVADSIRDLLRFLWMRRLWWLFPTVVVLLLLAGVIILGNAAGVGHFIYILF